MKKNCLVLILIISLFLPFVVKAKELNVKTLDASFNDNKLVVKGTVDDGVLAVAIMVYDSDEKEVIKFVTSDVDEDNSFEDNIDIAEDGTYVVKVANYDGGEYKSVNVTVSSLVKKDSANKISNPKTLDNIASYVILFLIAGGGSLGTLLYFKKKIK